jgi:hypothetical protein
MPVKSGNRGRKRCCMAKGGKFGAVGQVRNGRALPATPFARLIAPD